MRDPESFMLMIALIYAHGTWSLCEEQISMTLALRKPRFGLIFVCICGWVCFFNYYYFVIFSKYFFFSWLRGKE